METFSPSMLQESDKNNKGKAKSPPLPIPEYEIYGSIADLSDPESIDNQNNEEPEQDRNSTLRRRHMYEVVPGPSASGTIGMNTY